MEYITQLFQYQAFATSTKKVSVKRTKVAFAYSELFYEYHAHTTSVLEFVIVTR